MTESVFFQDLAVVMSIAGLAAMLFARFGWPKVFGYILVGILMNGHTWGGAFLADVTSVRTISQLGIVFLMFTMGLEFSTSEMKKIGHVTIPTAVIDTGVMVWLGYVVGTKLLGWDTVPSLFLGTAICDSATTLLAKMIGDMGWSRRPFVKHVIGTSVCEDIICVGLIALVTGFANGSGMSLGAVGLSMGGLFLFFLATIVFGLILVPRLLTSVAKRKDDEALLLGILGICFFISWVAYKFEYSLALGAFLVGILGSSSEVRTKLHGLVAPLKAMFAAMFFVSIGLLVDPAACWANIGTILLLTATVVVGKGVNCFVGQLLCGESIKSAVQTAMSLAQIGEFAFMVALLYVGISNDLTSPMFQVTIGVSLLTTLLNPLLIRLSDPVGDWVAAKCPRRVNGWLVTYRAFFEKYRRGGGANDARRRVKVVFVQLAVLAVLEIAVAVVLGMLSRLDWSRFSEVFERYDAYMFFALLELFLVAMLAPVVKLTKILAEALCEILAGPGGAHWQQGVRNVVKAAAYIAVLSVFFVEGAMIAAAAVPLDPIAEWSIFGIILIIGIIGWKYIKKATQRAHDRFEEALAMDERLAHLEQMMTIQVPQNTIHPITLDVSSPAIGETVVSLNIRARTGASIVSVRRGKTLHRNIGPEWTFAAGDTLTALGEEGQIAELKRLLGQE